MINKLLKILLFILIFVFIKFNAISQETDGIFVGQTETKIIELIKTAFISKGYKLEKDSYYAKDLQSNITDYSLNKDGIPYCIICMQNGKIRNFFMVLTPISFEKRKNFIAKIRTSDSYQEIKDGFFLNKEAPGKKEYDLFTYCGDKATGKGYIIMWGCSNMNLKETRMDLFNNPSFKFEILK